MILISLGFCRNHVGLLLPPKAKKTGGAACCCASTGNAHAPARAATMLPASARKPSAISSVDLRSDVRASSCVVAVAVVPFRSNTALRVILAYEGGRPLVAPLPE